MNRRQFIVLASGAVMPLPGPGRAQSSDRMRKIGVLALSSDRLTLLQQGLEKLGWVQGRNIQIEFRADKGDTEGRRRYAAELAHLEPDAIVTFGTPELMAVARETRSIPIVFMSVSDPVGLGFVASLARPGGNVTGFANFEPAIGGKWLQLLKEIASDITRAALLFNPDTAPFNESILQTLDAAAVSLAVRVTAARVRDAAELDRAFAAAAVEPGSGVIVGPDNFTTQYHQQIIALAARYRLPAIYPLRLFAGAGGLLVYGIDVLEQARRAATYVDRILKGEKPADLPVQAPTKYELLINLKTAKELGLTVPPILLSQADEVIE
jgi:putative tryptophan/tyrosine transport system substrate-binding protein